MPYKIGVIDKAGQRGKKEEEELLTIDGYTCLACTVLFLFQLQ